MQAIKMKTPGLGGNAGAKERSYKAHGSRLGSISAYEALKAELTAAATTSTEYEAACRQAAKLAGV